MPIDLDKLERLEREATPGPWKIAITKFPSGDSEWEYQLSTERGHAATPYSDFALIVAARNALPDLIAELRMLRAAHEERGEVQAAWAQGLRKAYEAGRLDALRGVQAAALYRHAELWLGRMRLTSADERRDIEACELAWAAAQAAEEIETQKGAGDDFDAMVRELRTLRARVTELERDARLGAVVREAVGCMNAYMVEGHTTAPGFTIHQERIISVHQLNVLRAIADALRAETAQKGGSDG